jgi:hypothetical protein
MAENAGDKASPLLYSTIMDSIAIGLEPLVQPSVANLFILFFALFFRPRINLLQYRPRHHSLY